MASAYVIPILRIKTKGISLSVFQIIVKSIQYFHFMYFEGSLKGTIIWIVAFLKKKKILSFILKAQGKCHHF